VDGSLTQSSDDRSVWYSSQSPKSLRDVVASWGEVRSRPVAQRPAVPVKCKDEEYHLSPTPPLHKQWLWLTLPRSGQTSNPQ
jgi:hypothetical protein